MHPCYKIRKMILLDGGAAPSMLANRLGMDGLGMGGLGIGALDS